MTPNFSRCAGLRLILILSCICLPAVGRSIAVAAPDQTQAGQPQTGPIDEPRSAEHEPTGPPIAKGAAAITQQDAKCSKRIIVNADALFKPGRWTLNPDGAETMNALAPLVVKAGKHPVRIEAFVVSVAPEHQNQVVAQRRAITVRGWLRNNGYVPVDAPVEGFGKHTADPAALTAGKAAAGGNSAPAPDSSDDNGGTSKDQRVEIVFDTCH
jgi:outer membrane protein OmpA-like peptidoglycan-associated protein